MLDGFRHGGKKKSPYLTVRPLIYLQTDSPHCALDLKFRFAGRYNGRIPENWPTRPNSHVAKWRCDSPIMVSVYPDL